MPKEYTPQQKHLYLAKYFFAVSDNPQDDVNPYRDLDIFLKSKIGSMNWGGAANVRKRSKERFSYSYHSMLDLAGVNLSKWDILEQLEDDEVTNDEAVEKWVTLAEFPPRHS